MMQLKNLPATKRVDHHLSGGVAGVPHFFSLTAVRRVEKPSARHHDLANVGDCFARGFKGNTTQGRSLDHEIETIFFERDRGELGNFQLDSAPAAGLRIFDRSRTRIKSGTTETFLIQEPYIISGPAAYFEDAGVAA